MFCIASCLRSASSLIAARLRRCPSPKLVPVVDLLGLGPEGVSSAGVVPPASRARAPRRSTRGGRRGSGSRSAPGRSSPAKPSSGSWRISIDWIIRGAMRSFMSIRVCCDVSSRMVLVPPRIKNGWSDGRSRGRRPTDPRSMRTPEDAAIGGPASPQISIPSRHKSCVNRRLVSREPRIRSAAARSGRRRASPCWRTPGRSRTRGRGRAW